MARRTLIGLPIKYRDSVLPYHQKVVLGQQTKLVLGQTHIVFRQKPMVGRQGQELLEPGQPLAQLSIGFRPSVSKIALSQEMELTPQLHMLPDIALGGQGPVQPVDVTVFELQGTVQPGRKGRLTKPQISELFHRSSPP